MKALSKAECPLERTLRFCKGSTVQHDFDAAGTVFLLGDLNLASDALLELGNMGDDADQTGALCQTRQRLNGLAQGFFVQRAKALVHKHGIQLDTSRGRLNL